MTPRCPLCESASVEEPGTADASDEVLETTHRCANEKCGRRFRYTPPEPFNRIRFRSTQEAA